MPNYFRAFAVDYDGTIAFAPRADVAALGAIAEVRHAGRRVVLVTGRILSELRADFADVDQHFDAILAENGAVVARAGVEVRRLATPVGEALAAALAARGVPARRGDVLLATEARHAPVVLEEIGRLGLELEIMRNRDALMVLPSGVSKGMGLLEVLGDLGISHHSTVGIGDAENDHSLFEACEVGVAVATAVDSLKQHADVILDEPGGAGVAAFLQRVLVAGIPGVEPKRWRAVLGGYDDGNAATIPAARANVLVRGESMTGKSYVAGLFAEELLRLGYSLVVFDLEGEHLGLGQLRGVVTLGGRDQLPSAEQLVRLARHRFSSMIVDLSLLTDAAKCAYTCAVLPLLRRERDDYGLPHWIFIDEAHVPLAHECEACDCPMPGETGFCFVTYRADQLCCRATSVADIVLTCEPGRVHVQRDGRSQGSFVPRVRAVAHVRHRHKYEELLLAAPQRFYFRDERGTTGRAAASLLEFREELQRAPAATVQHHAAHQDFSRWIRDVFQDGRLASDVQQAESRVRAGDGANGVADLIRVIEERYLAD